MLVHARPNRPSRLFSPILTAVAAMAVAGCGILGEPASPTPDPIVRGPLCSELPAGTDPGGPATLVGETADIALTWIPVLTDFEAAARSAGMDAELREDAGVTILAPTDDTFRETFNEATWDSLLLFRHDEMRTVVDAHLIDGQHSLADLLVAGTVTTRAGETITISAAGGMVRLNDEAQTLCGDYQVANARIHVIDGVLGELPDALPDGPDGN